MTYTTSRDRAPHSHITISSPLYAETRKGSDIVIAWVNKDEPASYMALGYSLVRPADVERLDAGQYYPASKDIGMYRDFQKSETEVRVGQLVLMQVSRASKEAREADERRRILNTRVRKTDKSDDDTVSETTSTLANELKKPTA